MCCCFLEEFRTSLRTPVLPLGFSVLGVARAFLLGMKKMGAVRSQTSPRKGCIIFITGIPAVAAAPWADISMAAQAGPLESTVDGELGALHWGQVPCALRAQSPHPSTGLLARGLLKFFLLFPSLGGDWILGMSGSQCSWRKPTWVKQRRY